MNGVYTLYKAKICGQFWQICNDFAIITNTILKNYEYVDIYPTIKDIHIYFILDIKHYKIKARPWYIGFKLGINLHNFIGKC